MDRTEARIQASLDRRQPVAAVQIVAADDVPPIVRDAAERVFRITCRNLRLPAEMELRFYVPAEDIRDCSVDADSLPIACHERSYGFYTVTYPHVAWVRADVGKRAAIEATVHECRHAYQHLLLGMEDREHEERDAYAFSDSVIAELFS